ncbi:unnamed protein product [Phaeothamnion confervicola]
MDEGSSSSWCMTPLANDAPERVRASTERVVADSKHVSIVDENLEAIAEEWALQSKAGTLFTADLGWVGCSWHYSEDAAESGPLTCQYVFVLDSLNFCFWPTDGLEYEHLATGLRDALQRDPAALSAERLMKATPAMVQAWVPQFVMPQLEDRAAKLCELGAILHAHFGGLAANLVAAAGGSATALVSVVTALLPAFRDESVHEGRQVFFYKRAQILAGDVWAAYGRRAPPEPFGFRDVGGLTIFADYRIPQVLASIGALSYAPALAAAVAARRTLPAGGAEEVEIRAATVQAAERLRAAAGRRGLALLTVEVDWLLWHRGEAARETLPPHHRCLTPFY